MQFYLDGFRPGDPDLAPANPDAPARRDALPAEVDVLIIGCGPAGLTLAAQLSAFPEISVAIVDQKSGPLQVGQADGIACRTIEMFNAFGFAEAVMREGYWVNEVCFWKPSPDNSAHIHRTSRIDDVEEDLSEFPHIILNQARVHDFYLDIMRKSPNRLEPHYGRKLLDLTRDDASHYPITARLEGPEGIEELRAKYVVGCDGARSQTRRSLGIELKGDSANQAWGVMDVLVDTDFPDLHYKCVIHSGHEGNMLIIPREGGYMARFYIELDKLNPDERVAERNITEHDLIAAAKRIFAPHFLEVRQVAWWSVYEIGQRVTDRFADDEDAPRIFIAGDACHTHSPKAGQGMNVSMGDAFNLGWKLAAVLRGQSEPWLLASYSTERRAIAQELIDFDRELAKMFSAPVKGSPEDKGDGVDPAQFQRYFMEHGRYTAGVALRYAASALTDDTRHQSLASGQIIGKRFHSAPVIRLGDGRRMHLGHAARADGLWRLYAFGGKGDLAQGNSPLAQLCRYLSEDPASPVLRHTPEGADCDAVIDMRVVVQTHHHDLDHRALPEMLLPRKGPLALPDFEKVFCSDIGSAPDIYAQRGIDRETGCVILVRPDQYISGVFPLEAHDEIAGFFDTILTQVRN